jgi:hypothetical protein
MTRALRERNPARQRAHTAQLAANLGEGLGISEKQLIAAARAAAGHLAADAALADIKASGTPLYKAIVDWARKERGAEAGQDADAATQAALAGVMLDTPAAPAGGAQAQSVLAAGIQDITNTLAGDFQLNDVLRMILETMYRAVGFTRVLLCVRDPGANALRGRFGFGADVDQILRRGFSVPLAPARDVFHAAVNQGADIFIEDVDGEKIREHVPAWYRSLVPARALLLFPVLVKGKPVGLLYADSDAGTIQLGTAELSLLKTLRNQAVLAIRQAS